MIVRAYDHDGNTVVDIEAKVGDEVVWKRNGTPGAFQAEITGFTATRVNILVYAHDGRPIGNFRRSVKPRFLRVLRAGIRLP